MLSRPSKNWQKTFKLYQSGEILPNLVTLVVGTKIFFQSIRGPPKYPKTLLQKSRRVEKMYDGVVQNGKQKT